MRKDKSQQKHAYRRFKERYGINYNQRLSDYLRCAVHSGGAISVCRSSNRVSIYDALFRPQNGEVDDETLVGQLLIIRFAFDRNRNQVITALPRDAQELDDLWTEDLF
jgi:hypothetical protein